MATDAGQASSRRRRRGTQSWSGFVLLLGLATAALGSGGDGARGTAATGVPATVAAALARTANDRPLAPGVRLVGPNQAVELLGVKFVGVNAENGRKLLLTFLYVVVVLALRRAVRALTSLGQVGQRDERVGFWLRQIINLMTAALMLLGLASIWFDDPARLATVLGLVTAGLAFAMQKVVTAVSGYFVILRGRTFNVGDRITMGGVRGDVVALGFIQTTILEMGQPPSVQQQADPAMWVRSRQYTGRLVTVTNDKIFDEPVYNYTREFPYIWEELSLTVPLQADRDRAEAILLDAARRHAVPAASLAEQTLAELERRYVMKRAAIAPRVYYRLVDMGLELTVRFLVEDHGIRDTKDAMTRAILPALQSAGIAVATASLEIVGLPPLRLVGRDPVATALDAERGNGRT